MIVDKLRNDTKIGFEHGILYCFNNNLKGELCDYCKSKSKCNKESISRNNMKKIMRGN